MSSEDDGSLIDRRLKTICQDLNQVIEQQLQVSLSFTLSIRERHILDTIPNTDIKWGKVLYQK